MNASINRELLRTEILRQAQNGAPMAITIPLLKMCFRGLFARLTDEQLLNELQYLEDKGFVAQAPKYISPENKAWRITAAGRDFLAEQGLE